jgi:hypothetical protein
VGATATATLVESLLADPQVQARIRSHPELSALWSDPAVRRSVAMAPGRMAGMADLLELVRGLTADPVVQRRIEADAVLRDLWNDPAVRQRVQPGSHP